MRRFGLAIVLAIGIGLAGASAATASTVSATCATLQHALDNATGGEVIKLTGLCSGQSFSVSTTSPFTLEGAKSNGGTPADGFNGNSGSTPILTSSSNVHLTIVNLLFEHASTSGCTNNSCDASGPAIQLNGNAIAVTIKKDRFISNTANPTNRGIGGAVYVLNQTAWAPITVSSSTFIGNSSADGGALYINSNGPVNVTGNTFTGNSVPVTSTYFYPYGGALDIEDYNGPSNSPVTVSSNTFGGTTSGAGNSAPGWGGAAFVSIAGGESASQPGQTLVLQHNKFIDNSVTGASGTDHVGGAIAFDPQVVEPLGFSVVQTGNRFQGNSVGGANANPSSDTAGGGAEWGTATTIKSTQDAFIANKVTETSTAPAPEGGAVGVLGYKSFSSGPDLSSFFTGADDVFLNNSVTQAGAWGGAIYTGGSNGNDCNNTTCPPSHLTLFDSTLFGNSVNSSSGEGAGIWGGPHDTLTVDNSIVFGNKGPASAAEIFGYFKPVYSHDDACTTAGGTTPLTGAGDICTNPKLASTGAETSSSPTIDKGLNSLVPKGLTKDVAGHARITEGLAKTCQPIVDMGAFESAAVKPAPNC